MRNNSFYDKPTEQSQVKARIVEKYFWAWAKVVMPWAKRGKNRIGYVDLFAGPGGYKDGTKSTPLLVLEKAAEDEDIREMLVSVFNDVNPDHVQDLQDAIDSSPVISNLKRKPIVRNIEVGEQIAQVLEHVRTIPTLFFVDPWGYKGLSLQLISSTVKNWGCDCIFFFNYNRINIDINNPYVIEHMNALFGKEQAKELRIKLQAMRPFEREITIVNAISQSLKEKAGQYVLPFCFKSRSGGRSSHHLIFVSKNRRGYEIMKKIMAKEGTNLDKGVPSFEYNPATHDQALLFEYLRPLEDLADMLMEYFAGETVTVKQILDQHYNRFSVGTRYIEKSYKECLTKLEADGKIKATPPASKRLKRKGNVTFGESVKVTFPPREVPQNGNQIQN
ncbi:MAG: three-Cys-motif partner protein TcmP [Candidatus Poribacteria bacterium]|nr:three-Cys-motif partner protein TcmP [Candidatus Poribacteria bacterium]